MVQVQKEAVQSVEQDGMVFIDEIDKIVVNHDSRYGTLWHGLMLPAALLHDPSDKASALQHCQRAMVAPLSVCLSVCLFVCYQSDQPGGASATLLNNLPSGSTQPR